MRQDQAFGSTEGRANEGRRGAEPRRAKRKTAWGREKDDEPKGDGRCERGLVGLARGDGMMGMLQ